MSFSTIGTHQTDGRVEEINFISYAFFVCFVDFFYITLFLCQFGCGECTAAAAVTAGAVCVCMLKEMCFLFNISLFAAAFFGTSGESSLIGMQYASIWCSRILSLSLRLPFVYAIVFWLRWLTEIYSTHVFGCLQHSICGMVVCSRPPFSRIIFRVFLHVVALWVRFDNVELNMQRAQNRDLPPIYWWPPCSFRFLSDVTHCH